MVTQTTDNHVSTDRNGLYKYQKCLLLEFAPEVMNLKQFQMLDVYYLRIYATMLVYYFVIDSVKITFSLLFS